MENPKPIAAKPTGLAASLRRDEGSVLCVASGSGQVAAAAVRGGANLLMAISAGIYRQLGVGSLASFLPFGNSNDLTEGLAVREILPRAGNVPVLAGLMQEHSSTATRERMERMKRSGIQGVVNWPTISFIDGNYRRCLEADGFDLQSEIELLQSAQKLGLTAAAFALSEHDASRFAAAGMDILILNIGLTHEADLPTKRDQLQEEIKKLHGMYQAVAATGKRPLLLAFGGAVTQPEDYAQIRRQVEVDGFAGGSVFERLPVLDTVAATVRDFRSTGSHPQTGGESGPFGEMLGQSSVMKALYRRIEQVAPYDVNVCIEGESGTGKELVATQIHRLSKRTHQSFVTVNCGAIPDSLLESELFGHEKGAFTGAHRRRLGKFELAQKGSLFLDEIADLSLHGQVALLRAIQQKEITRVGSETTLPIDVRIITASHQKLEELIERGKFRLDLFYRLNQITITVPPLRERREDIPLLVEAFLGRLQIQLNRKFRGLSPDFMQRLQDHHWPGNIRELQHVVGQAALLESGTILKGKEISLRKETLALATPGPARVPVKPSDRRKAVAEALASAKGNKSRAAHLLGITRPTFYSWLKSQKE